MTVSATEPVWSREIPRRWWDPSRRLLRSIRKYQAAKGLPSPLRWMVQKHWAVVHRFWSVITGAEIDLNCEIGGGLMIPHPNGIVIHPRSRIGPNCLIFQQVTLAGPCRLGGHVDIGAGAKLIGPLEIGDHVRIGANAVVTCDVPTGKTVVGIPARILERRRADSETENNSII